MRLNEIIQGDAFEELRKIPSESVQAVIADPPYYNVLLDEDWDTQWTEAEEYLEWTLQWVSEAIRVLKAVSYTHLTLPTN